MRGFTLRAIPVCFVAVVAGVAGCFSLGSERTTTGTPPSATHAYWQGINVALSQKPTNGDLRSLMQLVKTQTNTLRDLPTEGVDQSLVAAVDDVIKCEEDVIRLAETIQYDESKLRSSQLLAQTFADANRKAAESKKRLKALRSSLNASYGGGFVAIGG